MSETFKRLSPVKGSEVQFVSSRRAMGFPASFTPSDFDDLSESMKFLGTLTPLELAENAEDETLSLKERYTSGLLLGYLGDPRINVFSPQMISHPGGRVCLGLVPGSLEAKYRSLSDLGISKEWLEKECPQHEVNLSPFALAKYPVTHSEYRLFLMDTAYPEIPTSWSFGKYPVERANHPVYTVSEEAALAYTVWLSQKTGKPYRLPTEAEWEFAATGGEQREFPWGNEFREDLCNTVEAGHLTTTPVGIYPRGNSKFGVADLSGNVEEYVSDFYSPYPGAAFIEDDLSKTQSAYRVARGGSFTRYRDLARSLRRHGRYQKDIYVMGFRLALSE